MKQILPDGYKGEIDFGNVVHVTTLYSMWRTPMTLYANQLLKDIEESRDVVDEVFVNIFNKSIKCDSVELAQSLVFKSIRNKSLDALDKRGRRRRKENGYRNQAETSESITTKERISETDLYSDIWEIASAKLPDIQYKVFKLRFMDGMTLPQVAKQLGMAYQTAKNRTYLAINKMKEECRGDKVLADMYNFLYKNE